MMKVIAGIILSILIVSCADKNQLCECIEVGDHVNELSASFFDGDFSKSRQDSLRVAKDLRDSICEPYVDMMPDELHKAAAKCEALSLKLEKN